MTIQSIILCFLFATIVGAAFHLLRGGSMRRLGLHLLAANVSFFLGHTFGEWIDWHLVRVGAINLFPALLATIIGLILATALAGEEQQNNDTRKQRRKR